MSLEEKVDAQSAAFEAAVPRLLSTHRGKWVVWLDGVKEFFDTEEEAYRWGVTTLGREAGFVVDQVIEHEPVLLSAAMVFRFGT